MSSDSGGTETIVKDGLDNYELVLNIVVDREGEMPDRHAVMTISNGMDAGHSLKILHRLGNRILKVVDHPVPFVAVKVLSGLKIEFGKGCKTDRHLSEGVATGFESCLDIFPRRGRDGAGAIESLPAFEFRCVPSGRLVAGCGRFNDRPEVIHGLDPLLGIHLVDGFHHCRHVVSPFVQGHYIKRSKSRSMRRLRSYHNLIVMKGEMRCR